MNAYRVAVDNTAGASPHPRVGSAYELVGREPCQRVVVIQVLDLDDERVFYEHLRVDDTTWLSGTSFRWSTARDTFNAIFKPYLGTP